MLENLSFDKVDKEAIDRGLLEPTYDLLDRGGKRWRPALGLMFARMYGRNVLNEFEKNKDVFFICGLTEVIHNATLMIDDL